MRVDEFTKTMIEDLKSQFQEEVRELGLKEALLYEKIPEGQVRCNLCYRNCLILPSKTGFCRARRNIDGVLYALSYPHSSITCVSSAEAIETAMHFKPGMKAYVVGSIFCNSRCDFCSSREIATDPSKIIKAPFFHRWLRNWWGAMDILIMPWYIVKDALAKSCEAIVLQVNEPLLSIEYSFEIAKLAKENGLSVLINTNGFSTKEAIDLISPHIDAVQVGFKGSGNRGFYQKHMKAEPDQVYRSALAFAQAGIHVEIGDLIVAPDGYNPEEVERLAFWVKENLGADTPVIYGACIPPESMKEENPYSALQKPKIYLPALHAVKIAKSVGLRYVYGPANINTHCPKCYSLLILRKMIFPSLIEALLATAIYGEPVPPSPPRCKVEIRNLKNGCCKVCGQKIVGVWS
jgi:pyruvate formate lyase activating enzyme